MKNMFYIEVRKAIKNKYFLISILLGCAITLLSLFYNVDVYWRQLYFEQQLKETSSVVYNPMTPVFSLFNHWVGGEPFSMGSTIFFFVFPMLVAIPYGWSYCEEKRNGYRSAVLVRTAKNVYYFSKYLAVFLSGAFAMVVPLIFNFVIAALFFPVVTPMVIYDTSYGVFGQSLMSAFYYNCPFVYVAFYLMIDFLFGGLLACISFTVGSFIHSRAVVVILPQLLCLALHYIRQFLYVDYSKVYQEISPLYFLRPVRASYDASWWIVWIEAGILWSVTFFVSVVWERKREIF